MQREAFLSCPYADCYPRCDNCHKKRRTPACELATHGRLTQYGKQLDGDIINDRIPQDTKKFLIDKGLISAIKF